MILFSKKRSDRLWGPPSIILLGTVPIRAFAAQISDWSNARCCCARSRSLQLIQTIVRHTEFLRADTSGRAVWDECLQALACWNCEFESRPGHGCLSRVSVVCCQVEKSLWGADLPSRGFLPSMVCVSVISDSNNCYAYSEKVERGQGRVRKTLSDHKYQWATVKQSTENPSNLMYKQLTIKLRNKKQWVVTIASNL